MIFFFFFDFLLEVTAQRDAGDGRASGGWLA
jgi:hypothetical protein